MSERLPSSARSRSYDPEPPGLGFEGEVARLRAQVELSLAIERRRLASLGVVDGMHLLELACEPGFVTGKLAEWLPHSSIVALDPHARMLEAARNTLAGGESSHRVQ